MHKDPIKNLPVIPRGLVTNDIPVGVSGAKMISLKAWIQGYHKPYAMDIPDATAEAYKRKEKIFS